MADPDARQAVVSCGEAARQAAPGLAAAPGAVIDAALLQMASLLTETAAAILEANEADMARGAQQGLGRGLLDRLRLDEQRLAATARQLELLAGVAFPAEATPLGSLPGGLRLEERRVPIGVVGRTSRRAPRSRSTSPRSCSSRATQGYCALAPQHSPRLPPCSTTRSRRPWGRPASVRRRCSSSVPAITPPRPSWSASRA